MTGVQPDEAPDERVYKPGIGKPPALRYIDIYGSSLAQDGEHSGDLITYVNFSDRFDLDARIERARRHANEQTHMRREHEKVASNLTRLKRKGGILLADIMGHGQEASVEARVLDGVFHMGVRYELTYDGEITQGLFEKLNAHYYRKFQARQVSMPDAAVPFITLLYGEISEQGKFRFLLAGSPPPLVFSTEYDAFTDIHPERLVTFPPIGLQPLEDSIDRRNYRSALGYKKRYDISERDLLGKGDFFLLYTDGVLEKGAEGYEERLKVMERTVSSVKNGSARQICETVLGSIPQGGDDASVVIIKMI